MQKGHLQSGRGENDALPQLWFLQLTISIFHSENDSAVRATGLHTAGKNETRPRNVERFQSNWTAYNQPEERRWVI
jgi:hypothetical protein